jgi:hypothetical protein
LLLLRLTVTRKDLICMGARLIATSAPIGPTILFLKKLYGAAADADDAFAAASSAFLLLLLLLLGVVAATGGQSAGSHFVICSPSGQMLGRCKSVRRKGRCAPNNVTSRTSVTVNLGLQLNFSVLLLSSLAVPACCPCC